MFSSLVLNLRGLAYLVGYSAMSEIDLGKEGTSSRSDMTPCSQSRKEAARPSPSGTQENKDIRS